MFLRFQVVKGNIQADIRKDKLPSKCCDLDRRNNWIDQWMQKIQSHCSSSKVWETQSKIQETRKWHVEQSLDTASSPWNTQDYVPYIKNIVIATFQIFFSYIQSVIVVGPCLYCDWLRYYYFCFYSNLTTLSCHAVMIDHFKLTDVIHPKRE